MGRFVLKQLLCDFCEKDAAYWTTQGDRHTRRFHCGSDDHRDKAHRLHTPLDGRSRFMDVHVEVLEPAIYALGRRQKRSRPQSPIDRKGEP